MDIRMAGQRVGYGVDQLHPAFPVAHSNLSDQELAVVDPHLVAKGTAVPSLGIEQGHIGAGIDDLDFLRSQLAALDDHVFDLLANSDDAIDSRGPVFSAVPEVEREGNPAVDDEGADWRAPGCRERQRMREPFVHMNHVRTSFADQLLNAANRAHIDLIAKRQTAKVDSRLLGTSREHAIGTADDRYLVTALAQPRRSLKPLMDRTGVDLVELEDLEDTHHR